LVVLRPPLAGVNTNLANLQFTFSIAFSQPEQVVGQIIKPDGSPVLTKFLLQIISFMILVMKPKIGSILALIFDVLWLRCSGLPLGYYGDNPDSWMRIKIFFLRKSHKWASIPVVAREPAPQGARRVKRLPPSSFLVKVTDHFTVFTLAAVVGSP